jgi:hypothetical protein
LRNPWGAEDYNGPWSDKDTARWTADAKAKLGYINDNDGSFWMRFSDYHRIFEITRAGLYFDWKRGVKRTGWDRTKSGIAKLSWNVKVDKK